jgi:hypothetical protein
MLPRQFLSRPEDVENGEKTFALFPGRYPNENFSNRKLHLRGIAETIFTMHGANEFFRKLLEEKASFSC